MPLCSCSIQSSCLCFIIIGLPISFCAYFKSVGISLQAMLSSLYSSMLNFFFPHFLLQIISVRTGPQEHQTYGQTEKKTTTQKRPEPISKRISNTQKSSQFLSQLTGNAGIHSVVLCVLYTHRVIIFFFFCCFCCCFFSALSEVFFLYFIFYSFILVYSKKEQKFPTPLQYLC